MSSKEALDHSIKLQKTGKAVVQLKGRTDSLLIVLSQSVAAFEEFRCEHGASFENVTHDDGGSLYRPVIYCMEDHKQLKRELASVAERFKSLSEQVRRSHFLWCFDDVLPGRCQSGFSSEPELLHIIYHI